MKEYITNRHYQISEQKYPFAFEYVGQDMVALHISIDDGKPVESKLVQGNVRIKKVDEVNHSYFLQYDRKME